MTLAGLAHASPWLWIAVVFLGQALGSLGLTVWLGLAIRETLAPILILVLGATVSAFLAWRKPREISARRVRGIPLLFYALFIYSLSSRDYPGAQTSVNAGFFHLVEFFTLGCFLACFWYPLLTRAGAWLFSAVVVGSGLLYAVSDEIHQSFVPGRTPSVVDLVLDSTALVGACVVFLFAVNLRVSLQRAWQAEEQ